MVPAKTEKSSNASLTEGIYEATLELACLAQAQVNE